MAQYVGARAYMLQQRMECKGGKVYDIDNVQVGGLKIWSSRTWIIFRISNSVRRLAGKLDNSEIPKCLNFWQFDCDAVNLFQLGEFAFKVAQFARITKAKL